MNKEVNSIVLIFRKRNNPFLFLILLFLSACDIHDSEMTVLEKNRNINEWIQEYMDIYYLWNNQIPTKTDKSLYPDIYFNSLLYKAEDRFSYIAEDFTELMDLLNGVQMEAGYDFSLFSSKENNSDVYGIINYIKPDSPASQTDLKRGDKFLTVNGKKLTVDNYQELLNELSSPHTLDVVSDQSSLKKISLQVTKYEENPILLDTIYTMSGKKIAYLLFNFFTEDKGDNSYSYLKELNTTFGRYKQAGVSELVLDLRYNGGGAITVATALAGMISNRTSSDLFCIEEYNSIVAEELKKIYGDNYNKIFFNDFLTVSDTNGKIISQTPLNKLTGLNRLYVLVSHGTASSSELVINGLKPYMNVVLIGEATYGKNVGMFFLYEEDPKKQKDNRWGMLPIVVKMYNSRNESDYTNGFIPDIVVDEYKANPLLPLGDIHEILLETALADMGVQKPSNLRIGSRQFLSRPLLSSREWMPVRQNMIKNQYNFIFENIDLLKRR